MTFKINSLMALAGISILISGCTASDVRSMASGGESIPTTSTHYKQSNSEKVKLYYNGSSQPKNYKLIGRVSANNDNLLGFPHSHETVSKELKTRAARLGANGVINITSGFENTTGDAIIH